MTINQGCPPKLGCGTTSANTNDATGAPNATAIVVTPATSVLKAITKIETRDVRHYWNNSTHQSASVPSVTHPLTAKIFDDFSRSGVLNKRGKLNFSLGGLAIQVDNSDVVGGVLQSWFAAWLRANSYKNLQDDTQEFPDFLFSGGVFLELKTFIHGRNPAFDVANFASYVTSLTSRPERLNADYLIFSYSIDSSGIAIRKMWMKKVWQITGPSAQNGLNLQVKRGQAYNIRPKSWDSQRAETFASRLEFVRALSVAGQRFEVPGCDRSWLNSVSRQYTKRVGGSL